MTLEECNQRMEALIKDLPEAHANLLIGLANTANALIKKRIQTSGIDSKGEKYRDYRKDYKDFKTKEGKYKGFTDFSFTNRMWTSIKLVSDNSELFSGIARLTATGLDNIDKLQKNTKKFGTIMDLTEQEVRDLAQDYDNGILQIFRDHGL